MTSPWMPSHGRHQVNIGQSLARAIKSRKLNGSTTERSNLPERNFYAFTYDVKPDAIDTTRFASIKNPENTKILAEFPCKESNEVCTYIGAETTAEDVDCILMYDEETGQYTLEKLDAVVSFKLQRSRAAVSPAREASTSSTPSLNAKGKAKHNEDGEAERRLLKVPKRPSPATISNPTTKPTPGSTKVRTSTSQLPHSSSILTTAHATPSFKNDKPLKSSSSSLPQPKLAAKQTKRKAEELPTDTTSYAERPAKKARFSAMPPEIIELPKPKPLVAPLPLPGYSISSKTATTSKNTIPMTVPPGVSANLTMEEVFGDEDNDDDEEWEAVPIPALEPSQPEYNKQDEILSSGFGEEEEQEIDPVAFEAELNEVLMQMEDDSDGDDDDDMEPDIPEPISMDGVVESITDGESFDYDDYSSTSSSDSD